VRRLAFPVRLALVRVRSRAGAASLAALGIAAAAAMVAAVMGAALVARDSSLARAVEEIPDAQRAIRAVWFGIPSSERYDRLDARARAALPAERATGIVLFRQGTIAGSFLGVGGVDGLARWVRLVSGRLPRACDPERCEVVRIGGEGRVPARFVEVGVARLRSEELFGDFLAPEENALGRAALSPLEQQARAYHQPPPPPFVLAEGVAGLVALPELATVFRSYAWVAPLQVSPWEVDGLERELAAARSALQAESGLFDLTAPVEELIAAADAGERAGRRLLLVGGQAAALLLAFAVLAAASRRRDLDAWRRRLTWAGARSWQQGTMAGAEALLVAGIGVAAGWIVGAGAAAVAAEAAGSPPGEIVARSALSWPGLAIAAGLAVAAAAALLPASPSRWLDGAAAVALAVLVTGVLAGVEGWFLLLLPALATFAAAVALGRLLGPAARLLVRARRLPLRLAALSLARGGGPAAVAAAFTLVSLGLALFAESYRATLEQGRRDQAAYAVPLDYRIGEDLSRLIPVRDAAPLARFAALGRAEPVVRLPGGVARPGGATGITVLGIDPDALQRLRWRDDFSAEPPQALAVHIADPARLRGPRVEAGPIAVDALGVDVRLRASVLTERGDAVSVDVPGRLPEGGILLGLAIRQTTRTVERGADSGRPVTGELELGPIRSAGREIGYEGWVGLGGVDPRAPGRLRVTLSDTEIARYRPRQPTDGRPVPAIVSPAVAAAAGPGRVVPLQANGETLAVRVAAVARRFPGIRGEFAIADREALVTALTAARPGAAQPSEVWLEAGPEAAARLAQPPFHVLDVRSRRALEQRLEADPLARVALAALLAAAAIALALALAGLVLVVRADLRDERGELADLEAQGAEPRELRRIVRVRAGLVAGAGLVGGIATGAALTALVVDLVQLTANAGLPDPPLVAALSWPVLAAALVSYAAAVALLLAWSTRR
jgi:hypothetical protein